MGTLVARFEFTRVLPAVERPLPLSVGQARILHTKYCRFLVIGIRTCGFRSSFVSDANVISE